MNNLKISIIGHSSTNSITPEAKQFAEKIIGFIKKYNYTCCSGGCNGIIEYINTKLHNVEGNIQYYSPCKNLDEHNNLYNLSLQNVNSLHFNTGDDLNYNFIYRSLELIKDSDMVICFYGTWGTLGELDFAVMLGKHIIFIEEPNRTQMHDIYNTITNLSEYNYNENIYVAKNDNELELILEQVRFSFEKSK